MEDPGPVTGQGARCRSACAEINLSAGRVLKALIVIVAGLVMAGVAAQWTAFHYGMMSDEGALELFELNEEMSIPTWFSSKLLFVAALLLTAIFLQRRAEKATHLFHWGALALVFVMLSLDEHVAVHDRTAAPLREMLHVGGMFYFAWVIPALALVSLFALAYVSFLLALPRRIAGLFVVSGAIYVISALGLEMAGGSFRQIHGAAPDPRYALMTTVEEAGEMLGISLFIYALLSYMTTTWTGWKITLGR